jgi:hypothetical protein
MKTITVPTDKARHRFLVLIPGLRTIAMAGLLALCATFSIRAQTATTAPVGLVTDLTTQLLSAPLTTAQRQVLHAENFRKLPSELRPIYLHVVAYAVGCKVASGGQLPTTEMLAYHLIGIDLDSTFIYESPALLSEPSEAMAEFLFTVHNRLSELNTLISMQVANNHGYQQAMYAGAVCSWANSDYDYQG